MTPSDLSYLTIADAARRIRQHEFSAEELVEAALARISRLNPQVNAFITVAESQAREAARRADAELRSGVDRGPLHGLPIGLKDIIQTCALRTTAGSRILAEWVPMQDATVVERLRSAGAVVVGKTLTHEFAFGATTINPHYGPARNPWDLTRMTGGSSGGSAAAVAAGMVVAALGSDTGGSIRLPASVTGTVGLKPSYGRVSRFGVVPLSWSQDHLGPIARSARDAATVLAAIAGPDSRDPASSVAPVDEHPASAGQDIRGVRIGLLKEQFELPTSQEVRTAVGEAVGTLQSLGATVQEISFQGYQHAIAAASLILFAEAAEVHARWIRDRPQDYGEDVRARLRLGALLPAAAYVRAQRVRRLVIEKFNRLFEQVDVVLSPTVPMPAPGLDEQVIVIGGVELDSRGALLRNTRVYNLLGLPALSVPCGFSRNGLPIGLQLAGRAFGERRLLHVACVLEEALDLTGRRPPLDT